MDPLSEVFSLLNMRSARCTRLEAGGTWALRFPAKAALKFVAVLRGRCWILLPGETPHLLDADDTFLLSSAPAYVLANDLRQPPEDGIALFDWGQSHVARHGGSETVLLGGSFAFEAGNGQVLLDALPPFMHIPAQDPAAEILRGTLSILDGEVRCARMGTSLVTHHLADILLIQALRAYVTSHGEDSAGWLGALSDQRIGAALHHMHGEVGRHWTVEELACCARMSRSGFAARFKELVGVPPLDYLLRWRMQIAREALRRNEGSVASLAARLGYASESAFGNAFKRVFGRAPKRYWSGRDEAIATANLTR